MKTSANDPTPRQLAEAMADLLPQMFSAITALEARLKKPLAPASDERFPLTHQQIRLLSALEQSQGKSRMNELAVSLGIKQSTLSINVKRLVKMGYITKDRDPQDERSVHIKATSKALSVFASRQQNAVSFFKAVFMSLPSGKRQKLLGAHRFIVDTYNNMGRK